MRKFTFIKSLFLAVALLAGNAVWGQYTGSGTFSKITSLAELTDGYYVIVNSGDGFAMNSTNTSNYFTHTAITLSSGKINNPTASIVWKIQSHNDGGYTIYSEQSSKYVSYTGSSNEAYAVAAVTTANQRWSMTYAANVFNVVNAALTTRILQYNSGNPRFACYTSAQQKLLLYKMEPASTTQVATPTFTPAAGNYFSTQNVSISTTTAGATIRYTTNGDEPTEASTEFTTAISVSTTTTIKAKAFKAEMDASAVASATYSFPVEVANIAALRTQTAGSTLYKLTGEAILTYKTANRNTKYIQDATGGILIDDNSGLMTTAYNIGDGITGITGTLNLFNGMLQFIPVTDAGTATTTANVITPTEVTLNNLSNYPGQLVKVKNLTIGTTGNFAVSTNYNVSDGTNTAVLRTQYTDLPYLGSAIPTGLQDITGVVLMFNTTPQLIARTVNDISASVITSPTITLTEVTIPAMTVWTGQTDTETVNVSGAALTADIIVSIDGADASMFSVSPTTITQTDGSASATVTVSYSPTAIGSHTATLKFNSTGATEVTRTLSGTATAPPTVPDVFITEVYGGGGNSGAPYTNDFIELYNNTESSVNIGDWSVAYYSTTGTGTATTTNIITIPAGKFIPGKKHFLIQAAAGSGTFAALPTPDASGTINAGASGGKIILYSISDAQTITNDIANVIGNVNFVDYVPFGTSAAPVWGSAMTSSPTNATSASRKKVSGIYVYTENIGNDFEVATPSPENTGLSTALNAAVQNLQLRAVNGSIVLNAKAGELVEVYNSLGQKVTSRLTSEGVNTIPARVKGVVFVKIGSEVSKLIME